MRSGLLSILMLSLLTTPVWSAGMGIVESARLNVRSGPGLKHRAVAVLEKGTAVTVSTIEKDWVKIQWDGKTGYVKNRPQYIRVVGVPKIGEANPSTTAEPTVKQAEKDAETIRDKIRQGHDQVRRFTKKEAAIVDRLNDIDQELNSARQQVRSLEKVLSEAQKAIDRAQTRIDALVEQIRISEGYAAQRLVALYKLNWLGRMHVLASAESVFELLRRESLLERILDYDQTLLETLDIRKSGLQKLLATQKRQQDEKKRLEEKLQAGIAIMAGKKVEKEGVLEKIRGRKSLQMASIAALESFAKELDTIIENLHSHPILVQPATALPAKPFPQLKGLLKMPVEGKIVTRFGKFLNKRFNILNFNSGIDIRADRGDPVRCIYTGIVLFSGWLKGYGNMMIVDHGGNYYSVYANNEDLFKEKGQEVETGEVIATVGDTGSRMGPKLYFELRHGGKPMDPMDWIDKG